MLFQSKISQYITITIEIYMFKRNSDKFDNMSVSFCKVRCNSFLRYQKDKYAYFHHLVSMEKVPLVLIRALWFS